MSRQGIVIETWWSEPSKCYRAIVSEGPMWTWEAGGQGGTHKQAYEDLRAALEAKPTGARYDYIHAEM